MNFRAVLAVLATALTCACAAPPPAGQVPAEPSAAVASRELQQLVDAYFEERLRLSPLQATSIGDPRYNDRFDLRRFHTAILVDGPLPLDVLEAEVERWIAAERGG